MDVIIVCHTEFGLVKDKTVIADKTSFEGVTSGVENLVEVADKYGAKITFAVMPEVVDYFPQNIPHEIGLHIHPGWEEFHVNGITFNVGDSFLRENCHQSSTSSVLRDYSFSEQFDMIKKGSNRLESHFGKKPTTFVAGRWCIDNNTVKALIDAGITHECSAPANHYPCHYDWSRLPRICMPYNPKTNDYQQKGDLPLLIVPISQMLIAGNVNPEVVPIVGLSWLKAGFLEYYKQGMPLFHICLHSPCMCDPYFISIMKDYLGFISQYKNINFKFVSEISEYGSVFPKTNIIPYLFAINKNCVVSEFRFIKSQLANSKITRPEK